jgi:hypothetical protein
MSALTRFIVFGVGLVVLGTLAIIGKDGLTGPQVTGTYWMDIASDTPGQPVVRMPVQITEESDGINIELAFNSTTQQPVTVTWACKGLSSAPYRCTSKRSDDAGKVWPFSWVQKTRVNGKIAFKGNMANDTGGRTQIDFSSEERSSPPRSK